ncbi:hypothetical protein LSTR_LSTR006628 [Laodelphax striatellus]|uniref:Uncharacterized protein n=1 Tax=Laodelphax striatellus TaxID=195883 RepID=A0A482X7Y0_LAOST|nr:hypothetical protein LSTR_LSTR006628 [Laodelphax striatellus]
MGLCLCSRRAPYRLLAFANSGIVVAWIKRYSCCFWSFIIMLTLGVIQLIEFSCVLKLWRTVAYCTTPYHFLLRISLLEIYIPIMPSNQFPFLDAFLGQLEERAKARQRQYTPFRSLKTRHWGRSLVDLRGPLTRLSTRGLWAVPMVFRSEVAVAVVHIFDPIRVVTTSQLDLVKSTIRKFAQLQKARYPADFHFERYPIFESDLPRWKAERIIAVQLYDFVWRLPVTTVYRVEDDIWRLHQAFPALRSYLRDGSERVGHANDDALLDPGLVDGGATRHQPMSVEAVPSEEEDLLLEEGGGGFSFVYGKSQSAQE